MFNIYCILVLFYIQDIQGRKGMTKSKLTLWWGRQTIKYQIVINPMKKTE